ncbi:hypothetical protein DUHN55_45970 [Helicobacter pylori]
MLRNRLAINGTVVQDSARTLAALLQLEVDVQSLVSRVHHFPGVEACQEILDGLSHGVVSESYDHAPSMAHSHN